MIVTYNAEDEMILYLKGVNNNESTVEIYIYYAGGTIEVIDKKKFEK